MDAYTRGFFEKCAEHGVNPAGLLKEALNAAEAIARVTGSAGRGQRVTGNLFRLGRGTVGPVAKARTFKSVWDQLRMTGVENLGLQQKGAVGKFVKFLEQNHLDFKTMGKADMELYWKLFQEKRLKALAQYRKARITAYNKRLDVLRDATPVNNAELFAVDPNNVKQLTNMRDYDIEKLWKYQRLRGGSKPWATYLNNDQQAARSAEAARNAMANYRMKTEPTPATQQIIDARKARAQNPGATVEGAPTVGETPPEMGGMAPGTEGAAPGIEGAAQGMGGMPQGIGGMGGGWMSQHPLATLGIGAGGGFLLGQGLRLGSDRR